VDDSGRTVQDRAGGQDTSSKQALAVPAEARLIPRPELKQDNPSKKDAPVDFIFPRRTGQSMEKSSVNPHIVTLRRERDAIWCTRHSQNLPNSVVETRGDA